MKRVSLDNKRRDQSLSKIVRSKQSVFISHNFSDVEDSKSAINMIRALAAHAGSNAANEAKAVGISRAYVRHFKKLIRVSATGEEVELIPKLKHSDFYIKYKPYTVFHAVKK